MSAGMSNLIDHGVMNGWAPPNKLSQSQINSHEFQTTAGTLCSYILSDYANTNANMLLFDIKSLAILKEQWQTPAEHKEVSVAGFWPEKKEIYIYIYIYI